MRNGHGRISVCVVLPLPSAFQFSPPFLEVSSQWTWAWGTGHLAAGVALLTGHQCPSAGRNERSRGLLPKAPGDKYSNRQLVRNGNCSQSLLYAVAAARARAGFSAGLLRRRRRVWLGVARPREGTPFRAACSADSSPTHRTTNR